MLDRPVVELLGDPPPLGPLGEQPLGEQVVVAQSIIASRSAMATACVRVSASSFARMCRTWLFTVSCEMKRRVATSAFDIPSASSCRISRSRCGEDVLPVLAGRERRDQRRVDERLAARDLLDRLEQRLVRRLLEHVAVRARLEPALEERPLAVGGEDEHPRVGDARDDLLGRLDAVHLRHAEVHDHDVGAAPLGERDRGLAVGRLADDADVRRAQQREAQAFAHDLVVVRDQNGDLGVFRHSARILRVRGGRSLRQTPSASCSGSGAGRIGGRRGRQRSAASPRTVARTGSVSRAGR